MRRLVGLAACVAALAMPVALAVPANAVVLVTLTGSGVSPSAVAATTGTQFLFQNSSGVRVVLINGTGQVSAGATSCATASGPCSVSNGTTSGFTVNAEGSVQVFNYTAGQQGSLLATFYVNASGTDPSAGGGGVTSGPAPIVQQFGRPASGTCEAAASSALNWGGAQSGGWSESWAEWMNGGLGGAVCTRSLTFRSTTGTWSAS